MSPCMGVSGLMFGAVSVFVILVCDFAHIPSHHHPLWTCCNSSKPSVCYKPIQTPLSVVQV